MPDTPESKVRAASVRSLLRQRPATTIVKSLSGGRKARLLLGLQRSSAQHDHPRRADHHLDIDSRAGLAEGDQRFPAP